MEAELDVMKTRVWNVGEDISGSSCARSVKNKASSGKLSCDTSIVLRNFPTVDNSTSTFRVVVHVVVVV